MDHPTLACIKNVALAPNQTGQINQNAVPVQGFVRRNAKVLPEVGNMSTALRNTQRSKSKIKFKIQNSVRSSGSEQITSINKVEVKSTVKATISKQQV